MRIGRIRMGIVMVSVAMLAMGAGCASKQVASTSGDQSTAMKSKAGSPGPVENVQQDKVASVEPSSPMEPVSPGRTPSGEEPATAPAPGSSSTPSGRIAPGAAPSPPQAGNVPGEAAGVGDIFFDFDQYTIRNDAQAVLDANAAWLRSQPGKSLLIEGHCDERGTLAYNLVLGEKRAMSTKRYLEDLGISGSRIQTTSYGEVRPFCKDHNEGCWSKNRRAHFVVQ